MYMLTGSPWKLNGNTQQEADSTCRCTHGADHIHVTTKVASWPTSNRCEAIILTTETYMQGKSDPMNQMNMACMICQETFQNGHAVHTLRQLTSSSTICNQIMNIMPNPRILRL